VNHFGVPCPADHDPDERLALSGAVRVDARFPERAQNPDALGPRHEETEAVERSTVPCHRAFVVAEAHDGERRRGDPGEQRAERLVVRLQQVRGVRGRPCEHERIRLDNPGGG
jgi:hypothetical protein